MRQPAVCLVVLLCCSSAFAQQRFDGKRKYPQARSVSGLAGGGSAVTPIGKPSNKGALALSTPIAYTISEDHAVLTGGTTSSDANLRWFDGDVATNGSNGTAVAMFGQRLGSLNLGVSLVQTSRLSEDRVVNLQFAPRRGFGRLRIAAGVQDLLDQTVTTPNYGVSTRSFFVASTYEAGGRTYVTGGVGTQRFQSGFLSASAPLVGISRWMVEHDGYGWNYGVGLDLFKSDVAAFVGVCQGRYATWSLSLRF